MHLANPGSRARLRSLVPSMRGWGARHWSTAAVVTVASALLIGLPTGIVETTLYTRMTPVLWWNYPILASTAVLAGLITATYVGRPADAPAPDRSGRAVGATLLSLLAVGCPVCNKLVIALIGTSGALSLWAPLQPILGVLSVGVLLTALAVRMRMPAVCPVPATR